MQYKIKIMKFGGAAIKNKHSLKKAADILLNSSDESIICVVSAFGKTTSILKNTCFYALNNNYEKAKNVLSELKSFYYEFVFDTQQIKNEINQIFDELKGLLKGISITQELTKKTLDKFLSYGETIAAIIFENHLLLQNLKTILIDSSEIIITDSNFGNASPDTECTYNLIKPKIKNELSEGKLIIIPGFTAADKNGVRTTMGMESSNLTAILLADALDVSEITFWTDVKGIRTSDPKILENTLPVRFLSYEQARIAAYSGLKLIYPDMINFSKNRNVTLIYKSLEYPNDDSTIISTIKGKMPVLIIDDYYSLLNNNETFGNYKTAISAYGELYVKTFSDNSEFSLINVLSDDLMFKQELIKYLHNNFNYIKFEYYNETVSALLKTSNAINTATEIHKLITSFYGKDL